MDYNKDKYYLGKLCKYNHVYKDGLSLRIISSYDCVECKKIQTRNSVRRRGKKVKKSPVICKHCGINFLKSNVEIRYSKNHFCSRSCSATWNNRNKTKGYRRSKLEVYIENTIKREYPSIKVIFNDKQTIGSELDIYFPDLKLAVELNGIFHYEPIYGSKTFERIQNNDQLKMIHCYKQGIELLVIDTTAKGKRKYFNIIKKIIDNRHC
jgi:hypothetical protein